MKASHLILSSFPIVAAACRLRLVALMAAVGSLVLATATAAQFEDVTVAMGLTNETSACVSAAWGDYGGDGYLDLYLATGGNNPQANAFYRNDAGTSFTLRTPAESGPIATDTFGSVGCAWLDLNNDGQRDILVTHSSGPPTLYWNYGGGLFAVAVPETLSVTESLSVGPAVADLDGDGFLDIFLAQATTASGPFQPRLFHATSADSFKALDLGAPLAQVTAAVWGDYNSDGKPDLFVCAGQASALWRNDGRGQLTKTTSGLPSTDNVGHAAWADFNNDGHLDIALCTDSGTLLYRNDGRGGFVMASILPGPDASAVPSWADYDSDGRPDLLIVNGQASAREPRLYHHDDDGTFTLVNEPMTAAADHWLNCAWADFDNDGFMDVLLTHASGRNRLYRNLGNSNHWLKVKLTGVAANRDAVGARVHVKATIGGQTVWQLQEVSGGSIQQNDQRLNFGLGDATSVDLVRIEWPSGNVQEIPNASVNTIASYREIVNITPTNPSVSTGGSITLTSKIYGTSASYQWGFEGAALPGENALKLSVPASSFANQPGCYSVVVTTPEQTLTNHVYLTVDTTFTRITDDPVTSEASWLEACSWGDMDGDGKIDLFLTRSSGSGSNYMYQNQGDGTFVGVLNDVTGAGGKSIGCAWADFDNNGTLDLMVGECCGASDVLYANDGAGNFTALSSGEFAAEANSSRSVAWSDYDRDGNVDLFIVNQDGSPSLYHNDGDGTFTRITKGVPATDSFTAVNGTWCDYDGDGYPDLFVGTYSPGGGRLYHNKGDGTFSKVTTGPVVTVTASAWGSAWGDYDNDGYPDLMVARPGSARNSLFHNNGDGTFAETKTGPMSRSTAAFNFSGIWGDYDNDGYLDLFVSNTGNDNYVVGEANFLFHNDRHGGFTRVYPGSLANEVAPSTGCAWGDYDDDGFLDLVVVRFGRFQPALYHNNGNPNHWLKLRLFGAASNRAAIGTKVRVKATLGNESVWQLREISGGGSGYASQPDLRPHFGLGDATKADIVRIEWPSGQVQELMDIAANQLLTVWEPPMIRADVGVGGACHLTVLAQPDRCWHIESSTDLKVWHELSQVTSPSAKFEYTDVTSPHPACCFYRVTAKN
ncbi:MAG: FG-GAP-like repeat-containing protein [Verrucomicrobiia bacterium]